MTTQRETDAVAAKVTRLARKRRPKPEEWSPAELADIIRACVCIGARVDPMMLHALERGWLDLPDALELMLVAVRQIQPMPDEASDEG